MAIKVLWTGVTFFFALNEVLKLVGLNGSPVLTGVGAVLIVIGCILLWLDRDR